jgi:hypothetical protein
MFGTTRFQSQWIIIVVCVHVFSFVNAWSANAFAGNDEMKKHIDDYFDFLSDANLYSPMEGAGSHGSIGLGVGLGGSMHTIPENRLVLNDQLRGSDDFKNGQDKDHSGQYIVPRLLVHKGLPIPIDIGASISKLPETNAGVYAQWTLFESFALPAVAVRAKYSRLMGLPSTEFQTSSVEAGASYGLLRILNVYGTYGMNRHRAEIRTQGETGTTLAIVEGSQVDWKDERTNYSSSLGLQVQLMLPYCTTTIESRTTGDRQTWLAKLSVGL